jgi:hypothetical protein
MTLVDRDALLERIVYADLSTKAVNALHDLIDAAPTVACERCEHFATDQTVTDAHICLWYESSVLVPTPDFGCVYFQPSDAGGAG